MISSTALTGSHLRAYNAIFQHPMSHNLEWHDVHPMLRQLCGVEEQSNGRLKVTRNGHVLVLDPPRTKDVSSAVEIMALRHFLERSEPANAEAPETDRHWVLAIDHEEARIFRAQMHGAMPQQILPPEPGRYFRHVHHSKDFSKGEQKPDPNTYFGSVADAFQAPGDILVFGSGTGASSEMDQFVAWVKMHRPAIAARIIGSLVVDGHHLTTDQLLAVARDFYSSREKAPA